MIRKNIKYHLYVNGGIIKNDHKFKKLLKTRLISSADGYFSPSIKTDEYLIHYGAKKEKIKHYIYSTIFEKDISSCMTKDELTKLKLQANLNPNNINIVSFGQFIKRKSNLELISLVSKLPSNYHLTLIGSGKEKKLYESYIVANALGKRVTLLPFMKQNELLTYLRPYDCFISLSKEDIYGHMVNEALSAGLPVICSNKIVSAHKLVNKENGFIVDINDEKNIMDALNDFKNIKRENCLKTSYENTIEKMIESHLDILKD